MPEDKVSPNVYQRMIEVASKVRGVVKDRTNNEQKFDYASHDAVVSAVRDAMIDAGVLYVIDTQSYSEEILEIAGKYGPRTVFVGRGVYMWSVINVENSADRYTGTIHQTCQDSGDKASAKCLSYVKKYGLLACVGLLLPTGIDMDDPRDYENENDRQTPPHVTPPAPPKQRSTAKKPQDTPPAAPAAPQGAQPIEDTPQSRAKLGGAMFDALPKELLVNKENRWAWLQASLGDPEAAPLLKELSMDDYQAALTKFKLRGQQWLAILNYAAANDIPDTKIHTAAQQAGFSPLEWYKADRTMLMTCHDALTVKGKPAAEDNQPEANQDQQEDIPF